MSDLYKFGYTLDETIKTMRDVIDTGNHDRMFLDTYYWLKMLSEYREIGTVEDCREAKEKQNPKKPKEILRHRGGFEMHHCPNCDTHYQTDNRYTIKDNYCPVCGKLLDSAFRNYCGNCGQAIDTKNLEGMEDE